MSKDKQAALRVYLNIERPASNLIEPFAHVPTGNICDAMDRFGAMDYHIRPLDPAMRLCGPALTVRTRPGDNLAIYQALEVAQPGDILVISTYDYQVGSTFGDLVVNNAKRRGIGGIVCDGLCRDASGIRAVGLPVFVRGLSPSSPFKDGPGEINGPISCGGVSVQPGDVIAGDEDGVVVVPARDLQLVAERLKAVIQKEEKMLADLEAGKLKSEAVASLLESRGVEFIK
jgi:regulator of RNase E activity RraA